MVAAAFVAPYLMEATARFVADAAALPGVRLGLDHLRSARTDRTVAARPAVRALAGRERPGPASGRRGGERARASDGPGGASRRRARAAPGAACPGARGHGDRGHGRADRPQRARQVADEGRAPRGRGALRRARSGHRCRRGDCVRAGGRLPVGRQAAGRRRLAGDLPARRRRVARRLAAQSVPPSAEQPALLEEFLVGEEHTFDSVTVGGHTVWSSIADYQPPPLEVLRNPWIQWTVVLPRDISGPEYAGIHQIGPAALQCPRRPRRAHPHGVVPQAGRLGGRLGGRGPAARAQLTSMHGYSHDFDLFKAWAELVVLDRFDPPQRRYASGTAYLRGLGQGAGARGARCRGAAAASRSPRGGGAVAPARPAGRLRLPGRGLCHGPGRRHRGRTRCAPAASSAACGSSSWRPCERVRYECRDALPGLPHRDELLHPRARCGGCERDRGRRPASARRTRGRAQRAGSLRARLALRRGRRAGCAARPLASTCGSTRSSASGSPTCSSLPASGRPSGCPG